VRDSDLPFDLAKATGQKGTRFVVSAIDPPAREAIGDLSWLVPGIQPEGEEFSITYSPDTRHVDLAFANLQLHAVTLWKQTQHIENADWCGALRTFIASIAGKPVEWALIGGASLAIRGIEAASRTHDVDIITNPEGAHLLDDLFAERLIAPTVELPGFGWFGRAYLGASVEWLGNDTHPGTWTLDHPWEIFEWEGQPLRVPSLATYLRIERQRQRHAHADEIEARLAATHG
jgi:hypothetical protein